MKRVKFDGDDKHLAGVEKKKFSRRQRMKKFTDQAILSSIVKTQNQRR